MSILVNTSIALSIHNPKKDAVVAAPGVSGGADDVRIWAATNVNPELTQSIVGTLQVLHCYAQTNLNNLAATGPTVLHCLLGATESSITVDGIPTADELRLEIGANIVTKGQSHFLDRTFKRLIELWLETSKAGAA